MERSPRTVGTGCMTFSLSPECFYGQKYQFFGKFQFSYVGGVFDPPAGSAEMVPGSKRTQNDLGTNFHFCKVGEGTISSWNQPTKPDLHQNSHRGGPSKMPRAPWNLHKTQKTVFPPPPRTTPHHPHHPTQALPSSQKLLLQQSTSQNSCWGPTPLASPTTHTPEKHKTPLPTKVFMHMLFGKIWAEFEGNGVSFGIQI